MTKEYGIIMRGQDELHRGPWPERKVDDWLEEASDDGFDTQFFIKVARLVGPWTPAAPAKDLTVTREEADNLDHVIARLDNGTMIHAFEVTDKLREALVERGYGTYYGTLRGGGALLPVCTNLKRFVWDRMAIIQRGDITELDDTPKEGFNGEQIRTVCPSCVFRVKRTRNAKHAER